MICAALLERLTPPFASGTRKQIIHVVIAFITVVSYGFISCSHSETFAATLTDTDMENFLVQSLCIDSAGKPTSQIPIIDNCTSMRPQRADDQAIYQKHDWPDQRVYPHYFLTGHQASDSVLWDSAGRPVIEQTLDFGGDPQHHFGYFDSNDAGQVIMLIGGWASAVMTQDARGGVQWLIGEGCKQSAEGGRLSWLLFNRNVSIGAWAATIVHLNIARSQDACPTTFNPAYTQFRREETSFPFRVVQGNSVSVINRTLDIIMTNHYAGASPNPIMNTSLERFFFARNLGWVRWERWENLSNPAIAARRAVDSGLAQNLVASRRCPAVSDSTAPGPGWYEIDCRTWTTIVRVSKPWTVRDYRWPALQNTTWQ
jgi:hypothetical protein